MKKGILILACITLGLTTVINAKNLPEATKLPSEFKQEVTKHIAYPNFAKTELIEGEVWIKVTLDENSKVKIIDLSSTNQALGSHVKNQLNNLTIANSNFEKGKEYILKVKFNLI